MNEKSPPRKLSRSRSDRFIGGVAAGIANRFDVDPLLVRIAFVASLALGGLGVLAYLLLLAVMPVEGDPAEPLPPIDTTRRMAMVGLAVAVGVVGIVTANSGSFGSWLFGFWPGTLFGILFWTVTAAGAMWLLTSRGFGTGRGETTGKEPGLPDTEPPPPPPGEPVTYAEAPTQLSRTEVMETRQLHGKRPDEGGKADPGSQESEGPGRPVRDDGPSTIGKIMVWFAIGLTALTVFCLLFVFSAGTTAVFGGVPMAALVIVLGAGMIFAAFRGRRQVSLWLLAAAIAVTIPMAAVSIADLRVEGSYGEINSTPLSVVDVPADGYEMAAGNMTVDLRRFDFGRERELELPVRSGMGLTSIIVPDDLCVSGVVEGKAGVINFRGRESNGLEVSQTAEVGLPTDVRRRPLTVNLDGRFKLGAFEVVDDTQWRAGGPAGSFEKNDLEPDRRASAAARERAAAACAPPAARPDRSAAGEEGRLRS